MKPWTPEIEVSMELARSLIANQFPELRPIEIQFLDSGWDNVVYLVNQKWYFRFPQRQIAVDGVLREMNCLPVIQKAIELTPKIQFHGQPFQDYPYPFFGYEPLVGKEACEMNLSVNDRSEIAVSLGEILAKLHSSEVFESLKEHLPFDPLKRLDFSYRGPMTEARLKDLQKVQLELSYSGLDEILKAATSIPRLGPSAVVHGDLHFRHLIVTADRQFGGLIDWGDLHLNQTALDLQIYWSFLPPSARSSFQKAYGPISESQLLQARGFAVFINVALLHYAIDTGKTKVQKEALFALNNLLID